MALGLLRDKYETSGLGTPSITDDDGQGGVAYGSSQFSTKKGSLLNFIGHLQKAMPDAYNILQPLYDSSAHLGTKGEFGKAWQELAKNRQFVDVERAYEAQAYLDQVYLK